MTLNTRTWRIAARRTARVQLIIFAVLVVVACVSSPDWWPSGMHIVEYVPTGVRYGSLALSPNRRRLACARVDHDRKAHDVVLLSLDDSPPIPMVVIPNAESPLWLSDDRVLFHRDDGRGNKDLWIADANGEGERALTRTAATEDARSVATDHRRVLIARGVILRNRDGLMSGYAQQEILRADVLEDRLTGTVIIARGDAERGEPSEPWWSPDGERFIYTRTLQRHFVSNDLYVVNADGSGDRLLAANAVLDGWAPDGQSIYYQGGERSDSNGEIRWVNVDGSGDRLVLADAHAIPPLPSPAQWNTRGDRLALATGMSVGPYSKEGFGIPTGIVLFDTAGRVQSDLRVTHRSDTLEGTLAWDARDRLLFARHADYRWPDNASPEGVIALDPTSGDERVLLSDTEGYMEKPH
jgi:hypothetical protein